MSEDEGRRDRETGDPELAEAETEVGDLPTGPMAAESSDAPTVGSGSDLQLDSEFVDRYRGRKLLGCGGMGEVYDCMDGRIGRRIAMKVVRIGRRTEVDARARFLREARVQAQLEHPAVVPVYDLGRGSEGAEFFTMKKISGRTLAATIRALRDGTDDADARFPMNKLLSAFLQICLCVDYAHVRGVLHRDLKPSNIMLGDFGEVYLLDWGLAKTRGAEKSERDEPNAIALTEAGEPPTRADQIIGTPGYLAPEQVDATAAVDARSDIYGLGAILFELLARQPLHVGRDTDALVASTQRGADARLSERVPERALAPELEAICVKATAYEPADRYRSARELHDALERYLEGDRDLELRREMAARHASAAAKAAEAALGDDADANRNRVKALREVGRALALDPGHSEARRVLARMLMEPPRDVPASAAAEIDRAAQREARFAARICGYMMVAGFVFIVLAGLDRSGVVALLPSLLPLAVACSLCFVLASSEQSLRWPAFAILALVCGSVASISSFMGPLVLTPSLALAVSVVAMNLRATRPFRWAVVVASALALLVPAALEMTGVVQSSYVNHDGVLTIVSRLMEIPERSYPMLLLASCLLATVIPLLFVWRLSNKLAELRARLQLMSWHFGQLVPEEARAGVEELPLSLPPAARGDRTP